MQRIKNNQKKEKTVKETGERFKDFFINKIVVCTKKYKDGA